MAESEQQTILFLADHPEQYGVRLMLESSGYKVVCRDTLISGLQFLLAQHPDLLLVDCALENNRGLELCRTVCSDAAYNSVPVVMVGRDDKQATNCLQAFAYGAEDFVQAPFIPAVMQARVGRLLKKNIQGALGASLSVQVSAKELPGIMQYLQSEMKTGKLEIESGERKATVFMQEGVLVNARTPDLEGPEVITEVLCWPSSQVSFVEEAIDPVECKMKADVMGLVMNSSVGVDEYHEIRSNLPPNDVMFLPGKPLPDDVPETQRNIYYAALHGYAVEDLIQGTHASERKATLWLHELIEQEILQVGKRPFADYEKQCRKHYHRRTSYVTSRLTAIRGVLANLEFPLEQPPARMQMASCDWLSTVPRLLLVSDNQDHLQLFKESLRTLYAATVGKVPGEHRLNRQITVTRYDFGGKACFELLPLLPVESNEFGVGLKDYTEDAFAVLHLASAQDTETTRNAQRAQRLLRQQFLGVYFCVVPRVINDSGKALFKINCIHCGFKLAVDMDEAGFSGECPVCSRQIAIPNCMDNLYTTMNLPEEVSVVSVQPEDPVQLRDLFLLLIDHILNFCSRSANGQETATGTSGLQEHHRARKTQISVAETHVLRVNAEGQIQEPDDADAAQADAQRGQKQLKLPDQPPPEASQELVEDMQQDEDVDPNAFAPVPQEEGEPEDNPKVQEILDLLSKEQTDEDTGVDLNELLSGNDDEDIDDFINTVRGPR